MNGRYLVFIVNESYYYYFGFKFDFFRQLTRLV